MSSPLLVFKIEDADCKSSWTLGVATWTCSYSLKVVGACVITKFTESRSALWTWSPTKTRETYKKKIMCAVN
jgi:hypothetical protein